MAIFSWRLLPRQLREIGEPNFLGVLGDSAHEVPHHRLLASGRDSPGDRKPLSWELHRRAWCGVLSAGRGLFRLTSHSRNGTHSSLRCKRPIARHGLIICRRACCVQLCFFLFFLLTCGTPQCNISPTRNGRRHTERIPSPASTKILENPPRFFLEILRIASRICNPFSEGIPNEAASHPNS